LNVLDDQQTQTLEANGLRFAYQIHAAPGQDSRETIVLTRGLGTQMVEWSPVLIDSLVQGGLQVVIFDNRDVGLSSKMPHDYPLTDMAADVVSIMDVLDVERFHMFGISLGGMVAQLTGYLHGDRLRSLFSVMSTSGDPDLPRASRAVRDRLNASTLEAGSGIEREVENRALFGSPGYPETEDFRRRMSSLVHERCYHPAGVARQMQAAIADGSRVERLQRIRVPTLVIHGVDDPLIPIACGEDTARNIPGAEFQSVPGMGHNIPDALARDIADRVLRFVAICSTLGTN
jgi:pimeloyl-ACP methyl ester carboxylesterase